MVLGIWLDRIQIQKIVEWYKDFYNPNTPYFRSEYVVYKADLLNKRYEVVCNPNNGDLVPTSTQALTHRMAANVNSPHVGPANNHIICGKYGALYFAHGPSEANPLICAIVINNASTDSKVRTLSLDWKSSDGYVNGTKTTISGSAIKFVGDGLSKEAKTCEVSSKETVFMEV